MYCFFFCLVVGFVRETTGKSRQAPKYGVQHALVFLGITAQPKGEKIKSTHTPLFSPIGTSSFDSLSFLFYLISVLY